MPVDAFTLPNTVPSRSADIVPAEKFPEISLATTLPTRLELLASTLQVISSLPSKFLPVR